MIIVIIIPANCNFITNCKKKNPCGRFINKTGHNFLINNLMAYKNVCGLLLIWHAGAIIINGASEGLNIHPSVVYFFHRYCIMCVSVLLQVNA
jgi:hypothetical protein